MQLWDISRRRQYMLFGDNVCIMGIIRSVNPDFQNGGKSGTTKFGQWGEILKMDILYIIRKEILCRLIFYKEVESQNVAVMRYCTPIIPLINQEASKKFSR